MSWWSDNITGPVSDLADDVLGEDITGLISGLDPFQWNSDDWSNFAATVALGGVGGALPPELALGLLGGVNSGAIDLGGDGGGAGGQQAQPDQAVAGLLDGNLFDANAMSGYAAGTEHGRPEMTSLRQYREQMGFAQQPMQTVFLPQVPEQTRLNAIPQPPQEPASKSASGLLDFLLRGINNRSEPTSKLPENYTKPPSGGQFGGVSAGPAAPIDQGSWRAAQPYWEDRRIGGGSNPPATPDSSYTNAAGGSGTFVNNKGPSPVRSFGGSTNNQSGLLTPVNPLPPGHDVITHHTSGNNQQPQKYNTPWGGPLTYNTGTPYDEKMGAYYEKRPDGSTRYFMI